MKKEPTKKSILKKQSTKTNPIMADVMKKAGFTNKQEFAKALHDRFKK